ncbi:MAG: hypothetical protein K2X50_00140 [Gammaproteobacteria bacterium]|nr:hypothetical protein [Gammaproteobacteria bacterium]
MSRTKYMIESDPSFFKTTKDSYPLSYRCIILHSLYEHMIHLLQQHDENEVLIEYMRLRDRLNKIITSLYTSSIDQFKETDLFEIYIFSFDGEHNLNNIGAMFVDKCESQDKKKGVYPLVFYPDNVDPTSSDRKTALFKSLNEILKKWDILISILFYNAKNQKDFIEIKEQLCTPLEVLPSKINNTL